MFDEFLHFNMDVNGRNIYDHDMDDDYGMDDCDVYTGKDVSVKKPKWQWKCADGTVMNLEDMTDKHLENSIKYCERRNATESLIHLQKEEKRRKEILKQKHFDSLKTNCQFCGKSMVVKKFDFESSPDDGPGMGWSYSEYRLVCKCGSMGPVIKTEGIKP